VNLEDYRTLFMVGGLVLVLVAAFPGISVVFPFQRVEERFSELWLLGPEHKAVNYPLNIRGNEMQGPIYVGVSNHMRDLQYYMVYVKLRNQTQPLPDASTSESSPLPPLCEFRFFLADGETWETSVSFNVEDVDFKGNSGIVRRISINDHSLPINLSSSWDSENEGFYYQLFYELWLYDATIEVFGFHDRFVWIWLNMTSA
jgi:hypothetical protein